MRRPKMQTTRKKNSFYDTLERTFDSLPKNSIKLIVEDLNAQVGRETPLDKRSVKRAGMLPQMTMVTK